MSNPKWEVGPVKLVNGQDATIYRYCEKRRRYLGCFETSSGPVYSAEWTASGSHSIGGIGDPMLDLVPPQKKKIRVHCFANVYADGDVFTYGARKFADESSRKDRFALIEIDREVEEGEGL